MPKNIVVFSDGTGQEGGVGPNTNVYKLFNRVVDRDDTRQITFYDRGLGTDAYYKISGMVAGLGISRNVRDCYKFIFDHYSVGDRIFLFGFSRGATTVRSLSGFIHYFGILPQCRPELVDQAYSIYRISNEKRRVRSAQEFLSRHHTMWTRVHFLGVWDTVAALGLPWKWVDPLLSVIPGFRYKFHNLKLSASVTHARHALAIDDVRKAFAPVLWEPATENYQTLKQVWFAGMHTDVGGGYAEQTLSDNALRWMEDEATREGLLIYPKNPVPVQPDPSGMMHDSRQKFWEKLIYRVKVRRWDYQRRGLPTLHKSVVERQKKDPSYQPWILQKEYVEE